MSIINQIGVIFSRNQGGRVVEKMEHNPMSVSWKNGDAIH